MKEKFIIFVLGILLTGTPPLHAQNPDAIVGKWWNEEKTAQIEVYSCDGKFCGKIIWLKEPHYPAEDPKGMAGKPRIDRENPDPSKKEGPILGMNMVWGFSFSKETLWEGGFIYDPREGKT